MLGAKRSTLIVTGYTVNDGNGGNNYTVTTHHSRRHITPAALTITATSDTKAYDGNTSSSQTPTYGAHSERRHRDRTDPGVRLARMSSVPAAAR